MKKRVTCDSITSGLTVLAALEVVAVGIAAAIGETAARLVDNVVVEFGEGGATRSDLHGLETGI